MYGNLTKETPTLEIEGSEVEVLDGDIERGWTKMGDKATVSKVCLPHLTALHTRYLQETAPLPTTTHPHRHVRRPKLPPTCGRMQRQFLICALLQEP
jgi:hypothetical protein